MTEEKSIEHHTNYKEIHGFDETTWMTDSEHKKLHFRLRKSGKCNIPVDELRKISKLAHSRTKKSIETRRKYRNSESGKKTRSEYNHSEQGKKVISEYTHSERRKELQRKSGEKYQFISFSESVGLNAGLHERITYNLEDGSVKYRAWFRGHPPFKVPNIDI